MKTIALLAAAALAATTAALPSPAAAQPAGGPRIAVGYSDLDLGTPAGRAALDLRLLHAARTACGTPSSADSLGHARRDACVAEARAAVAAQRDSAIALASRRQPALAGR